MGNRNVWDWMHRKMSCIMLLTFMGIALSGCGSQSSVSFDSAEGLTKQQIKNEISEQTDDYGEDAKEQADEIYDAASEKSRNGVDSLIQSVQDVAQGKTKGVNVSKLTKNGLYYFLVIKQYLYEHFIKVLFILWLVVGLLVLFFRLKNKAAAKAVITVLGFGVSIFLAIVVFSPI